MAESVQKFIESTIPELKDLQKRKIFSEIEIKAIVKKRTDFEYGVRRRCAKKVDFLRYIEYELSLNQLRLKRKQRLQIHSQAIKGGAASEYSMVRRVHHIFDRLSRKFPGDLGVWMEYLRFARRANSSQKLAKIFLRALQLHPRCPELWVAAAGYEWDQNGSAVAARSLFQQALRLNEDSELLWLEYFKMELLFVCKLLERKRVLLIAPDDSPAAVDGDTNNEGNTEGEGGDLKQVGDLKEKAEAELRSGVIAQIVFDSAMEKLGASVRVKVKDDFLNVVKSIETSSTSESMTEICERLKIHIVNFYSIHAIHDQQA